jgi:hypothetical protein
MSAGVAASPVSSSEVVLLEHLATCGWFAAHGEVALTSGLAFCLQKDPSAAGGFVRLVRERAGMDELGAPHPDRWITEVVYDRTRRVDVVGLWGRPPHPAPVVFVEAKVAAGLGPGQIAAYAESQQVALAAAHSSSGALVVLVPAARTGSVRRDVATDLARLGAAGDDGVWTVAGDGRVSVIVMSWEDALASLMRTADAAIEDVRQLDGGFRALAGAIVPALDDADLAGGWRQRDDLGLIIDGATRAATENLDLRLAPWQPRLSGGLSGGFRYIAPAPPLPSLAVGSRTDSLDPPLWVRWHRQTPDITAATIRLGAAGYRVERFAGHYWLPLHIPPDRDTAASQVATLAAQIVTLYRISAGLTIEDG